MLFCTGLAAALAKREKHQAAFIALMSYLVYLTAGNVTLTELGLLAQPDALTGLYSAGQTMVLGIQTVDTGVFGGILLGLLTAFVYDRTCEKAHRGILGGVFSGVRWSFACVAALAAVLGSGACFVWPPIQKAIAAVTGFIAASGNIGLFLYGFLERLLIPTGLHHLVYMPFQFSQLGGQLMVGSVTYTGAYVVMMTEYNLGLPFSDGIVWMYTGFTKTFGYFGIAAAFIFCARRGSRKKTALQLLPLAFTASLASITEPLDFLFCFSAPVLWLAHAAISGSFIVLLHLCGVTAFTSNLLGSLVMNLSAGAARTNYPVLYLLGLAQIAVYFVVFTVLIKALEENGIGRPSTYAPIITTIIDRGYVERDQKKLKPTLLGRAVDGLMLEQFPHIVDVDFSAQMEKNLDKVESGKADWRKTVDDFYQGFEASLEQAEKNMEGKKVKVPDEPSSEVCDLCGRPMVIKVGKYGKFLACSGFPECRGTKRLVKDTGGICPKCGKGRMLERKSAKGRIYYGCERYPDCDFMTWDMPVATKCEKCGSTLFRKGSKLYCAKEGCGFEMPVPKKD